MANRIGDASSTINYSRVSRVNQPTGQRWPTRAVEVNGVYFNGRRLSKVKGLLAVTYEIILRNDMIDVHVSATPPPPMISEPATSTLRVLVYGSKYIKGYITHLTELTPKLEAMTTPLRKGKACGRQTDRPHRHTHNKQQTELSF